MPQFLSAIATGQDQGIFRASEKPDVTQSPIPHRQPTHRQTLPAGTNPRYL